MSVTCWNCGKKIEAWEINQSWNSDIDLLCRGDLSCPYCNKLMQIENEVLGNGDMTFWTEEPRK